MPRLDDRRDNDEDHEAHEGHQKQRRLVVRAPLLPAGFLVRLGKDSGLPLQVIRTVLHGRELGVLGAARQAIAQPLALDKAEQVERGIESRRRGRRRRDPTPRGGGAREPWPRVVPAVVLWPRRWESRASCRRPLRMSRERDDARARGLGQSRPGPEKLWGVNVSSATRSNRSTKSGSSSSSISSAASASPPNRYAYMAAALARLAPQDIRIALDGRGGGHHDVVGVRGTQSLDLGEDGPAHLGHVVRGGRRSRGLRPLRQPRRPDPQHQLEHAGPRLGALALVVDHRGQLSVDFLRCDRCTSGRNPVAASGGCTARDLH